MGKELPNASTGGGGKYGNVNVRTGGGIDGENGTNVDPMYRSSIPKPPAMTTRISSSVKVIPRNGGGTGGAEQVKAENARSVVKDAKALKAANAPTNQKGDPTDRMTRSNYKAQGTEAQVRTLKQKQSEAKRFPNLDNRNTKRGK